MARDEINETSAPPATGAGRLRFLGFAGRVAAGLWVLLGLAWLAEVAGGWNLVPVGRLILPLAVAASLLALGRFVVASVGAGGTREARWVVGLLALALLVRVLGADYEVEERAYQDEGTYYHHAQEINQGKLLRFSFVYPHLLYYLDAFTLWTAELYGGTWARVAAAVFGVTDPLARAWLALRLVAALLSALATGAVFAAGRRLAGLPGGVLAAVLLIASPLWNDGSHLFIADVPSGVFAAVSWMFALALLERERRRDYLLAGVFAGLAAATKYPAGLVAVAIVAAWIRGRLATRKLSLDLVWAALAAFGTFLAMIPTAALYPKIALFGDRGMLFGVRQYSKGGWIGVMPESNLAYYGGELVGSFGWAVLVLGLAGLLLVPREQRRTLAWALVYPLAFLALVVSMNMVVRRNLYPVMPQLAVLLGAGIAWVTASLAGRVAARWPRLERGTWVAVASLALVVPVRATIEQTLALTRPGTREVAAAWIAANVPTGAGIVKEAYTPDLDANRWPLWQSRFVGRLAPEEIEKPPWAYVLLAKPAYGRFLAGSEVREPHHHEIAARYRYLLASYEKVAEFAPTPTRRGPWLELYRIRPRAGAAAGEDLGERDLEPGQQR